MWARAPTLKARSHPSDLRVGCLTPCAEHLSGDLDLQRRWGAVYGVVGSSESELSNDGGKGYLRVLNHY